MAARQIAVAHDSVEQDLARCPRTDCDAPAFVLRREGRGDLEDDEPARRVVRAGRERQDVGATDGVQRP